MLRALAPLLAVGLAWATIRDVQAPAIADHCSSTTIAANVRSAGLVFVGPPWLGEYLLVSQAPSSVAGMSNPVRIGLRRSLASRIDFDVLNRPDLTVGNAYQVNPENLLRLGVVVAIQAPFAPRLAAVGLCTASVGKTYGTPEAIAQQTRLYASLVNDPPRGERLLQRFDREIANLARQLPDPSASDTPNVAIVGMSKYGQVSAQGGRHPASAFIARAGGINALKDVPSLGVHLDAERLLTLDPDNLFLNQSLAAETPSAVALRKTIYGSLRAVQNGHVYAMPPAWTVYDSVVETPSYERWMAERLHPELGSGARYSLQRAYNTDLGVELPDKWIDYALSDPR